MALVAPPPVLDSPDLPRIMSPALSSPKSLLLISPAIGEVKGWLSSLFHWRMHALAMHSHNPVAPICTEICRLTPMLLPEPQPDGALCTRIEDVYGPTTGSYKKRLCTSTLNLPSAMSAVVAAVEWPVMGAQ